jgi:hypothetical protein
MVPPQVGKNKQLCQSKAVLVWNGPHHYIPPHHLLPLQSPSAWRIGTAEVFLPGLATFKKAGLIAGPPPPAIYEIFPPSGGRYDQPPLVYDADDIYAHDGTASLLAAHLPEPLQQAPASPTQTSSLRGGRGSSRRAGDTGRQNRGGRGGRGERIHGLTDSRAQFQASFVPSAAQDSTKLKFWKPERSAPQRQPAGISDDGFYVVDTTMTRTLQSSNVLPDTAFDEPTAMDISTPTAPASMAVTRSSVPAPTGTVALSAESTLMAYLASMSSQMAAQYSQTSATLLALTDRLEGQALAAARHTEATVNRATLQSFGREAQAALDQTDWDIVQCTDALAVPGIADWYRTVQTNTLTSLRNKRVSLALRKTELEQEYRLLTASDDSVIARPSP